MEKLQIQFIDNNPKDACFYCIHKKHEIKGCCCEIDGHCIDSVDLWKQTCKHYSMNPKDNCFFSTVIDNRPVCTYHADKDKDYLEKERPCECMNSVCPLYISGDEACNIVEALKKRGTKNE